jgi:hypothetical protein
MRWKSRRFGADPREVAAAAVGHMLQNKIFEEINGLYVKYSKGKPVILNLSEDEADKLRPKGELDDFVLKKHGISSKDGLPFAEHPIAGVYDLV